MGSDTQSIPHADNRADARKIHAAPLQIFLSYGHDAYADMAAQIKADFEAHGHLVWFDI